MKATFQQPSAFAHQFRCENQASGDAVATGVLLRFGHGHEGLRCRVLHHQVRDDSRAVIGDRGFSVGLVQHFVQTIGSKSASNQVTESH